MREAQLSDDRDGRWAGHRERRPFICVAASLSGGLSHIPNQAKAMLITCQLINLFSPSVPILSFSRHCHCRSNFPHP